MIAAGQWQPVDSRKRIAGGKTSRNCARARNWLPGLCGLLPLLAYKQEGPLATQQLRIQDRKIMSRQRLRQHAALVARAVWLKQSRRRFRGDSGKAQEPTSDAVRGGWPRTAFYLAVLSSQFSVLSPEFSVLS